MNITKEITLDQHPCSIETFSENEKLFFCGNYQLYEQNNGDSKAGELGSFLTSNSENNQRKGSVMVINNQLDIIDNYSIPSAGVLDMKYSPNCSKLACALSNSSLAIFDIKKDSNISSLISETGTKPSLLEEPLLFQVKDEENCSESYSNEGLILSVDWNKLSSSSYQQLIFSTQNSSVFILDIHNERIDTKLVIRETHKLCGEIVPVWISCFGGSQNEEEGNNSFSNIFLTGGDDCCLRLWDQRIPERPIALNKTSHTAGVTSAQWCFSNNNIFATGSYDETIRIFDDRNIKIPVNEYHTGTLNYNCYYFHIK